MSHTIRTMLCVLLGIACAMAFTLSAEGFVGVSDPPSSATSVLWSALAGLFAWLFWQVFVRRGLRPAVSSCVFGLIFGVVNAFATTLFAYDSWAFLNGASAWCAMALRCLGQALPMIAALQWIGDALQKPAAADGQWRKFPRLRALYRQHTTLLCAVLFALCWLPFLAAFYPGTVIWDMGEMVGQFFGQREMTTWHPVFLTWMLGACVWLGRLLGSDNIGAFLFTLVQTALLAYALGAAVRTLRLLKARRWMQLAAIALFGFTPIFASFAQAIGKDTVYTAVLLLFVLRTILLLRDERWLRTPAQMLGYGAAALLTCLFRSNGVYVVLPTAILAVAFAVRGKARIRALASLGAALALNFLFSSVLVPALGVKDETASGLYSVCFQQTARTLRDHADTITAEEYEAIDRTLDAARLPTLYESGISDPVKFTFRQYGQGAEIEKQALAEYRQTWLGMLAKYPTTYLEAFIAGNSGYYAFIPKIDSARTFNYQGGIRFVFETYSLGDDARLLHTAQIPALEKARQALAAYARGWRHAPLLQLLMLCPLYTWLLVAAGLAVARQRRWRDLIAFVPALLSLGVCMLSPVNDYFRYFLPIVAMAPPLLAFAQAPDRACQKAETRV